MTASWSADDERHLTAAEGWLLLGDYASAFEELDGIGPRQRAQPAVLKLRLRVWAAAKQWEACLAMGDAVQALLPADPEVTFILACAAAASGRAVEARDWLARTFELAARNDTDRHWKLKAVDEPALAAFWSAVPG